MGLSRSTDLSVDINGDASGYERAAASAERATASARRAVTQYDRDLQNLGRDVAKLEKQLGDDMARALDRQHAAMTKTGHGMVLFGGAVAAGLALAGREAMKWQSEWTGVQKTVSGTPAQLDALEKSLRQMAKTLPTSHEEIAAIAEAAGQLGVATPNIASFTKVMVDLSQSTNLTADEAATSVAQFMNVMKSAPDTVSNFGAALASLGNNGASTESDIVALAQRLSGAGKLIGASESDVLGLASAMANLGIQAELGGGAASRSLTKMYAAVKGGGPKLEAFAATAGMSAQEFADAFNKQPMQALDAFLKGLGHIKDSGGNVVAALNAVGLSGTQNMQVILRLAGAGDQLTNTLALSSKAWKDNTALVIEANQRYATAESKAKVAMNTIRDGAIDVGAVVLPIFVKLVDIVANVATAFGDLPGPVKTAAVILAVLAAALALAGGAALIAIPKIAAFKVAVAELESGAVKTAGTRLMGFASVLTGPWGLALAGATVALGIFAAKHGEAKREIEAVKATLDQQTGAVTDNTAAWLTKKFLDDGIIERAKKLGLSLDVVAQAALGQADALNQLKAASEDTTKAADGAATGLATLIDVNNEGSAAAKALASANGDGTLAVLKQAAAEDAHRSAIRSLVGDLGVYTDRIDTARGQLDLQGVVTQALTGKTKSTGAAFADAAGDANDLTSATVDLKKAFDDLAGAFLDERSAGRAVRGQLRDIHKALRDYAKEHGNLNGAFKRGTKSGDDFAEMLDGLAQKYQDKVDATMRATGSEKEAQKALRESRARLFEVARQLGMNKQAAHEYVREVLGIPAIVDTKATFDGDKANADAGRLLASLRTLDGKTVNTYVNTHLNSNSQDRYGPTKPHRAGGGPVVAGQEYWVGEQGPELWTAKRSGRIIPHRESMDALRTAPSAGPLSGQVIQGSQPSRAASVNVMTQISGPIRITGRLSFDKSGRAFIEGIADDVAAHHVTDARRGASVREGMDWQ
jgi:TP901 family phage tail tape measure protein